MKCYVFIVCVMFLVNPQLWSQHWTGADYVKCGSLFSGVDFPSWSLPDPGDDLISPHLSDHSHWYHLDNVHWFHLWCLFWMKNYLVTHTSAVQIPRYKAKSFPQLGHWPIILSLPNHCHLSGLSDVTWWHLSPQEPHHPMSRSLTRPR